MNGKAYTGPVNLGSATSATLALPENSSAANQVYALTLTNSSQPSFLATTTLTVDRPKVVTFLAPGGSFPALYESFGPGLAVDPSGNVWATGYDYSTLLEAPLGASPTGLVNFPSVTVSGVSSLDGPEGIAVDPSGNVWVANYSNDTVTEIPAGSTPGSTSVVFSGSSYSFDSPEGIAVDPSGNVWVANYYGDTVTEIPKGSPSATPVVFRGSSYSFSHPYGIAVDSSGNVWVANYSSGTVTEIPKGSPSATPVVFPNSWFDGGAESVAVDGAGNVWVGTYYGLTEIPAGSTPSSTPVIFSSSLLDAAGAYYGGEFFSIAVDQSGNVWLVNYYRGDLQELVGVAAPRKSSVPLL